MLRVTVRDRKGLFVSGLQKESFSVYEDAQTQSIQVVKHEDVPVAVGLVIDNSGSMKRKRQEVTAAALAFVRWVLNRFGEVGSIDVRSGNHVTRF